MSRKDSEFHFDEGKSRIDLIPPVSLREIGFVFTYGSEKYGDRNWEKYANKWDWTQLYASALRHITAWAGGEDMDPESGLSHLSHAATNLTMLIALIELGYGVDDRTKLTSNSEDFVDEEELLLTTEQGSFEDAQDYLNEITRDFEDSESFSKSLMERYDSRELRPSRDENGKLPHEEGYIDDGGVHTGGYWEGRDKE